MKQSWRQYGPVSVSQTWSESRDRIDNKEVRDSSVLIMKKNAFAFGDFFAILRNSILIIMYLECNLSVVRIFTSGFYRSTGHLDNYQVRTSRIGMDGLLSSFQSRQLTEV